MSFTQHHYHFPAAVVISGLFTAPQRCGHCRALARERPELRLKWHLGGLVALKTPYSVMLHSGQGHPKKIKDPHCAARVPHGAAQHAPPILPHDTARCRHGRQLNTVTPTHNPAAYPKYTCMIQHTYSASAAPTNTVVGCLPLLVLSFSSSCKEGRLIILLHITLR